MSLCLICQNNMAYLKGLDMKRRYNSMLTKRYEEIFGRLLVDKTRRGNYEAAENDFGL